MGLNFPSEKWIFPPRFIETEILMCKHKDTMPGTQKAFNNCSKLTALFWQLQKPTLSRYQPVSFCYHKASTLAGWYYLPLSGENWSLRHDLGLTAHLASVDQWCGLASYVEVYIGVM